MKLPQVFERYRAEVDTELRSALADRVLPMYDMMRYHLGWQDERGQSLPGSGGKALRPTTCLLACEIVGGEYRRALPAAAAMELVHNFSLIHDDIQDGDSERRHRPTVWSVWGKPQAINAGTAMRIVASLVLLRLGKHAISADKQLDAQRLLDESCLEMIEGQYLDISFENRLDITTEDYLRMIDKKTAALISCSFELGALLGTDDKLVMERFRCLGRNLGLAFQIRDDILGIWGDEALTGKPRGSDIRHRKKSFPVVYLLERVEGEVKRKLASIYEKEFIEADDLETVWGNLESVDALLQSQQVAEKYCEQALGELERLPLSPPARRDLEEMAFFLVRRDS
ncbi:polyprenyl synthetase family protein [Chloroflexota bacterium]